MSALGKCTQKIGEAVLGLLMMAAFATALGVFMIVSAWFSGGISGLSPLWYWSGIIAGSILWWGGIAVWVLFQRLAERRKLRQEAEMTEQEREERSRTAIAEFRKLLEE
ncbi:MAG TPA: hypothetical protein VNF04_08220 [Stellaceae bacterium]|nr:hypothetical protein [Stellaceae bacterium]